MIYKDKVGKLTVYDIRGIWEVCTFFGTFWVKNVVDSKHASRRFQSLQKRVQSIEHVLVTKYDAAEVLIGPLEL